MILRRRLHSLAELLLAPPGLLLPVGHPLVALTLDAVAVHKTHARTLRSEDACTLNRG